MGVMPRKRRAPSPERLKTDDSLRMERRKSDDALRVVRDGDVRDADGVIDHARAVADAVLTAARARADQEALRGPWPTDAGPVIGERATADRLVSGERASADVTLDADRKERVDALEALLVHERAATDAFLLTERARSDEAVAHRDDFLGMVAHDLRNLLNGVVLSLELLRMDTDEEPPPQVAAATTRIRRYVARMNRLIGDLVDVTSIDAGKLAILPVRGDAVALVAEAAESFQPAALAQGISLSTEIPAGPLFAEFDHGRILQVLANLIANALKFTPSGGQITVGVAERRGILRFVVSDTGLGIPATRHDTIFERFWQVDAYDRRGQGLGLYISKCIVKAHGGRIWAESELGKGARLQFTLPVSSARQRAKAPAGRATRDAMRKARRRKGQEERRRTR